MVAYKNKDTLYQAFMREAHHDAPNRQSEKLVSDVKAIEEQARANKTWIEQYDGNDAIADELRRPKPMFE